MCSARTIQKVVRVWKRFRLSMSSHSDREADVVVGTVPLHSRKRNRRRRRTEAILVFLSAPQNRSSIAIAQPAERTASQRAGSRGASGGRGRDQGRISRGSSVGDQLLHPASREDAQRDPVAAPAADEDDPLVPRCVGDHRQGVEGVGDHPGPAPGDAQIREGRESLPECLGQAIEVGTFGGAIGQSAPPDVAGLPAPEEDPIVVGQAEVIEDARASRSPLRDSANRAIRAECRRGVRSGAPAGARGRAARAGG